MQYTYTYNRVLNINSISIQGTRVVPENCKTETVIDNNY